jgi:hypothetical protein
MSRSTNQIFPIIAMTRNHFAVNGVTQGPDVDGALLLLQLELCGTGLRHQSLRRRGFESHAAILLNWVHKKNTNV